MNFSGIIIGICTFGIIGILHPVVIHMEYYIGVKSWSILLFLGIISIVISVQLTHNIISPVCAILGFSLLWSIHELFEQRKRVAKGWYPANPQKDEVI